MLEEPIKYMKHVNKLRQEAYLLILFASAKI